MDEEKTPSKRITRGSIVKSQINQQEGMSKSGKTKEVMHVAKLVDVLISKKKRKVKEIASTSNKQDKSVDVLISKKKRKVKEIASTSNKEDAQSDSVEQLHFNLKELRCFMLREVEGSSTDAIMIYINGTTLRFTRRDFCLVSGLKCSDDLSEFVFNIEEPNRILQMYFSEKKSISKAEFVQSFNNKVWGDNADDALKFGILYFIHSYILSEEPISTTIERIDFDLVESGMILNRVTKKDYPRIEYFMKGMFRDVKTSITFRNITPTPLEIAIIPFPSEYVQSDTASPSITPSNIEADDVIQSPDSDDDFQDPPKSINNKGKEKTVSDSDILPTKKWVRQFVPAIPKKIPPKVVQDHDIKRPQTRNAPVSPSVKTRCVKEEFTNLRKLIQDNFNVVLNAINTKKSTAKSSSSSFGLQRPDEMNNFENNEVPVTDELSLDLKKEEKLIKSKTVGQSLKVPITDELSPDDTILEMLSHVDASYNRVLMKSPILISGLQLSRLNLERSIVLHSGAGVVDETPIHRIRRLGRYNTSPYITTFESSSGSSSTLSVIFDQKHPFDSISGTHDTSLYINFWKWLREGLLARHQNKDCGLYISAYAEFLSDGNGISIGPFDPDLMRSRYAALLWNYNMLKIQAEAISDSEAPDKPIRSNVDVDSSERITIIQFYYIFFMFV
ncbi:hypothetical protein KY284_005154 [Solanum tuberosum]|nr:hypothetical protein KY284_005154 [Solanum tuberosum]